MKIRERMNELATFIQTTQQAQAEIQASLAELRETLQDQPQDQGLAAKIEKLERANADLVGRLDDATRRLKVWEDRQKSTLEPPGQKPDKDDTKPIAPVKDAPPKDPVPPAPPARRARDWH
jgi:ABC-type nitrate/sulfonate/bicarbonate transport system substrate-binding protein